MQRAMLGSHKASCAEVVGLAVPKQYLEILKPTWAA